ncbi:MAG: LytTR family transcriptional regulator [Prevotella sp.]|nr:LytTR family transcriptional regulator [Prevotella sp.]
MTPQKTTLCLGSYDELYIIDLNKVIYMEADDHYTNVFYAAESSFMLPYGLGDIEKRILDMPWARKHLMRLGRKYIVNLRSVFRINTVKETIFLVNPAGGTINLHVSKPVLRSLIDLLRAHEH